MQTTTVCELVSTLVLISAIVANSQSEGDSCFHAKRNSAGTCKPLNNCPSAVADVKSRREPQKCSFKGKTVIVCCPQVGEKSRKACESYEHLTKQKMMSPLGEEFSQNICPWQSATPVIYGGEKSVIGEFPHMALIGYGTLRDYHWGCGGTLISESFVLTAAHCQDAREFGEAKIVRLGDLNYNNPNDNEYVQQINVKRFIKHPGYKFPKHYHDLAVLELERPVKLNLNVRPACIHLKDPGNHISEGIVTGWGIAESGTPSEDLLKATVQYFSTEVCSRTYRDARKTLPNGLDSKIQICYGSSSSIQDTCQGDSGGPIQIESEHVHCSYDVFGVTSFGPRTCGRQNVPSVYVKLYSYIDWIESKVWP